jgi:uncharacterized protein YkwD
VLPIICALGLLLIPTQVSDNGVAQTKNTNQPAAIAQAAVPDTKVAGSSETLGLTGEENNLVSLVNEDRISQGLAPLKLDFGLVSIARAHSKDMSDRKYFDHRAPSPGPITPMDRYLAYIGYRPNYAMIGENIYYRSTTDQAGETAKQAETAFMESPGHRANILQPKFTKVGIGFYRAPDGKFWVTEMFLGDTP